MIPVVMSGGSGTRLWPLSRKNKPKQFLPLFGDQSLFQETITRLSGVDDLEPPIIICNEEHRFMVAEHLHELDITNAAIILEPCARNTAPAITVAAIQAQQSGNDPVLLVLSADHVIQDIRAFHKAIEAAKLQAEQGYIVTFGIVPTEAHTGYGYIKAQEKNKISKVAAFVEKPDKQTAQTYIESGNYYWNSGMFMSKASTVIGELEKFAPDILSSCLQAVGHAIKDLDFLRLEEASFSASPSGSIDYAVMEKTDNAVVIPLDAGWSDVGSWASLAEVQPHDNNNNVAIGDVLMQDVNNAYIHSDSRLVTVLGVDNIVVVETPDAVLVTSKDQAENIKSIVEELVRNNRNEVTTHRKCHDVS